MSLKIGDIVFFIYHQDEEPKLWAGKIIEQPNGSAKIVTYLNKQVNMNISVLDLYRDFDSGVAAYREKFSNSSLSLDELIDLMQYLRVKV